MHADLANGRVAALDDDFIGTRGYQFAHDRIAAGIVWRDGDALPRPTTDGVRRVSGCDRARSCRSGHRKGVPGRHGPRVAVANCGDAFSPAQ